MDGMRWGSPLIENDGPERAHFRLSNCSNMPAVEQHRHALLGHHRLCQHHRDRPRKSVPPNRSMSSGCAPTCAGMPWSWW
jgi:hypothetical protein